MKKFIITSSSIYIDVEKVQSLSYIEIHHSLGFFMENGDSYQVALSDKITKEAIEKYMPFLVHYCFARKSYIVDIYHQTKNGFLSNDNSLYENISRFLLHSVFEIIKSSDILYTDKVLYTEENLILRDTEILISNSKEQDNKNKELLYLVKFRHSRAAVSISANKDMSQERKEMLKGELDKLAFRFNDYDLGVATITHED